MKDSEANSKGRENQEREGFQRDGNLVQDPLFEIGLENKNLEDFFNQFFSTVESVNVKNLSDETHSSTLSLSVDLFCKKKHIELLG